MKIQSFINGLLVGYALGILFAPERGEETRRKISKKVSDAKDSVRDTYHDVAARVSDQVTRVKNTAADLKNKGERKLYEGTDDIRSNNFESPAM